MSDPKAKAQNALARYEADSASALRGKLQDKHASASNWIVASLFAVNGAGALHILDAYKAFTLNIALAAVSFLFGILFCFWSVVFDQISDRYMIPAIHSWGLYWTSAAETAERDVEEEGRLKERIKRAAFIGRMSRIGLILSAIDFLIATSLLISPALTFLT